MSVESCGIAKCLSISDKNFHPLVCIWSLSRGMSVLVIGQVVHALGPMQMSLVQFLAQHLMSHVLQWSI